MLTTKALLLQQEMTILEGIVVKKALLLQQEMTVLVGIVVKKDTSVMNVQNLRQKASMDAAKAGMVIGRNNLTIDTH